MTGRHAADHPADETADDPTIRVVSGDPSSDELAAVTAVLASLSSAEAARAAALLAEPPTTNAWIDGRRPLRQPMHPGPGQWGRHPG